MANPTVDRRVRVGDRIYTKKSFVVVTVVLKHAYRVVSEDGEASPDIWSWNVEWDASGRLVTNQY